MAISDLFGERFTPLINYNYIDFSRGLSVENFYGGKHMFWNGTSMVSAMILSNKTFYSDLIASKKSITSTTYVGGVDLDFDLEFKVPRVINGVVLVQIPQGLNAISNIDAGKTIYLDVYLRRVDVDNVASLIVSGSTLAHAFNPPGADNDEAYSRIETIGFDLANEKFRRDEKLRINIKQFARSGVTTLFEAGIAHDPINRADNNEGRGIVSGTTGQIIQTTNEGTPNNRFATDTNLIVQIPFKIDI